MSYIQIEIGGKLRGLKFNQGALITISELTGETVQNSKAGYAVIFAGLDANCFVKREQPDFTLEDVCDWVDDLPESVVMEVIECFTKSKEYQKRVPSDDVKKNQFQEPITELGVIKSDADG